MLLGLFSLSVFRVQRLVVSRALFRACRLTVSVATTLMSLDQTNKGSAVMLHLSCVCLCVLSLNLVLITFYLCSCVC